MNALFGAGAGDAWILDTISTTSGTVNQVKTLLIIGLVMLAVNIILSLILLVLKILGKAKDSLERQTVVELIGKVGNYLNIAKGYEHLGRVHTQETRETLKQVNQGVETITNAATETRQAAKSVSVSDRELLEKIDKLKEVLERRAERINNPLPMDGSSDSFSPAQTPC